MTDVDAALAALENVDAEPAPRRRRPVWVAGALVALAAAAVVVLYAARDTGPSVQDRARVEVELCLAQAGADVDACLEQYAGR